MNCRILIVLSVLFLSSLSVSAQNPYTKEKLPNIDKNFSVVAHIVLDSLGGTKHTPSVASLNALFAPIGISFTLCETRIIENHWYTKHNTAKYNNKI